jgi:anti-sigma B factor antagonist
MTWMPGTNPLASTAIRISEHPVGKEPIPSMNADTESIDKGQIIVVAGKDGALVYLKGRIDIDFSPVLRNRLLVLLQAPRPKIVCIDLSAVTHIDSSGIATLIEVLRIARGHNTELRLQGLHGRLFRLFESTGILSLFDGNARRPSQRGCKGV